MDPALLQFFDVVCEKIAAHPSYGPKVEDAVRSGRQLVLNYHTHGPEQGYCVSVCIRNDALAQLGIDSPLEELAHIRGIGKTREECAPRMEAFSARLLARHRLAKTPVVFLDGEAFEANP